MKVFRQRVIQPELLDHSAPEDAALNLADIIRLNAQFGGHNILRQLLRRALPVSDTTHEKFTVLDVGAASGDTARGIAEEFPEAFTVSLDLHAFHLRLAPHPKLVADSFQLPFRDNSFDYAFSSLFLHHFTEKQILTLLRESARVARRAVLVSDLERNLFSYLFLPVTKPFFKWHWMTVHDGCISVKAAFQADELAQLLREAGLKNVDVQVHRPAFRLSAIGMIT